MHFRPTVQASARASDIVATGCRTISRDRSVAFHSAFGFPVVGSVGIPGRLYHDSAILNQS